MFASINSFSSLSFSASKDMPYYYPTYTPLPLLADSDSFASSARQAAYKETAAQRRARVEFLQKREGERRVENWVRAQIENSAFMVSVSAVSAAQQSSAAAQPLKLNLVSKGHRRDRHQSFTRPKAFSSFAFNSTQKKISDFDNTVLNALSYDPRQGLTPISEDSEEEEPYIFYSTPLPPPAPLPVIQPQPQYPSYFLPQSAPKKSPRHGSPRHRRHASGLASIPEDMEEE